MCFPPALFCFLFPLLLVMAGLRRSKNGVASLAYVPAIHIFAVSRKAWMPAFAGMTEGLNFRKALGQLAHRQQLALALVEIVDADAVVGPASADLLLELARQHVDR